MPPPPHWQLFKTDVQVMPPKPPKQDIYVQDLAT